MRLKGGTTLTFALYRTRFSIKYAIFRDTITRETRCIFTQITQLLKV
jgi:hypothetical protein